MKVEGMYKRCWVVTGGEALVPRLARLCIKRPQVHSYSLNNEVGFA